MKKHLPLYLLPLLVACNSADRQDASSNADTLVTRAHDAVPVQEQAVQLTALFSVMKGVDPAFDPKNFSAFAEEGPLAPDTVHYDRKEMDLWNPWLLYNADSSRAIDLVSYNYTLTRENGQNRLEGAGPDMEIAVLDRRRNTRQQLLFAGPGTLDLDAVWKDPNTVLLALAQLEPGSRAGNYRYRLTLHKYDLQAGRSWVSLYPVPLSGNPADLMQKDFEK